MMKHMTRKLLYIVVFIVISALGISALASEKVVSFTDVSIESPCYEAITYFAGKGIVSGQKDGKFHPNDTMTSQEWSGILAALGDKHTRFDSNSGPIDRAVLYASIWNIADIEIYSASQYGYVADLDAGTTAMAVTGLIRKDDVNKDSISRGEALRLLYEVTVKNSVPEVPDNLVDFFPVTIGDGCSAETESQIRNLLSKYPNNQLALLLAYHYQFVVLTDLSLAPNGHSEQLGFEDVGEHIIYLNESGIAQALIHEVGHAVETCHSSYSKTWKLNKAEGVVGAKFLGEYAGTNANEYIAEATRYYIENKDNAVALEKMKAAIPQTYEHLTSLMSEDPSLTEVHFLSAVFGVC